MCEELAGYDIRETIQHDDFHDGQIFVRDGRYAFLDWGDACGSHPFFTMTITLWSVPTRDRPRVRDAYLEPWTRFEQRESLLAAFDLAFRLGTICRASTWQRVLGARDPALQSTHAAAARNWLRRWVRLSA